MIKLAELQNISKYYGKQKVLDNINITIYEKNLIGLVGLNGSGKTTLLLVICGIITEMEGFVIKDKNIKIGALIEKPNFYAHLSASQNLSLIAQLKGIKKLKTDILLEQVGLHESKDKKFSNFSLGMKQRLGIAATLIDDPDIILLDEPTNGLDPHGIREIREIIYMLQHAGKTLIISSHILSEIEQLCTHIILLEKGVVRYCGDKQALIERAGNIIEVYVKDVHLFSAKLKELNEVDSLLINPNSIYVFFKENISIETAKELFEKNGIDSNELLIKKNKIENALFQLIY